MSLIAIKQPDCLGCLFHLSHDLVVDSLKKRNLSEFTLENSQPPQLSPTISDAHSLRPFNM